VFALLLVIALTVATLALAHRLELLTDVCAVIGASVLGGLAFILAHPAIDLVAEPRDESDASCSVDELPLLAPVVERISVADARALLDEAQVTFVDARPGHDYTIAHVPGAMNLPAADAEGLLDMQSLPIPPEGQVITYCDGGRCEQSEYLGMLLRERDVCQQVLVLDGGWQAWVAAGAPTVAGSSPHGSVSTQPPTSEASEASEPVDSAEASP
jgi:rhodanese-related sulfurtransferase